MKTWEALVCQYPIRAHSPSQKATTSRSNVGTGNADGAQLASVGSVTVSEAFEVVDVADFADVDRLDVADSSVANQPVDFSELDELVVVDFVDVVALLDSGLFVGGSATIGWG